MDISFNSPSAIRHPPSSTTYPSRFTCLALFLALGVALLVRLHCLRFRYLFLDEFVTLWSIGGASYTEMLDRALRWTASGPLFVLCYRLSCDMVGDNVLGLKLPGIIAGVVEVWAMWWATRQLFRRDDLATLAAWGAAIAPQFVAFSQEGRPYMPAGLLITLGIGSLAGWLRTSRRANLAAVVLFSLASVGLHLLASLAVVAQNLAVIGIGWRTRWPWRRWVDWLVAQLVLAIGLWFAGPQCRTLSERHDSMLLETKLPMQTRRLLDDGLRDEARTVLLIVLVGLAIACSARLFPQTTLAQACQADGVAICTAVISYVVPTALLSLLAYLRIVDCWARYYFLSYPALMMCLAWVVNRPFPRKLSYCAAAVIGIAMLCQYRPVGGVPACRLYSDWIDAPAALADLRSKIGPGDLVLSRSGLVEANNLRFLTDPVGGSYLKHFLEAGGWPPTAEHIPLPCCPESEPTLRYLETLAQEKLSDRSDFWLVNVGIHDFDYRDWVCRRVGTRFHKAEESRNSAFTVCHYIAVQE